MPISIEVTTKVVKVLAALLGLIGIDMSPDQVVIISQAAMLIYAIAGSIEAWVKHKKS